MQVSEILDQMLMKSCQTDCVWIPGIFFPSVDRFNEESEHQVTRIERSNTTPLLEERKEETTETSAQS